MKKHFSLLALGLALSAQAIACSGAAEDESTADSEEAVSTNTRIYEKDNGKTIDVDEGKNVYVYLDSKPSTGYDWVVSSVDRSIGAPTIDFLKSSSRTRFKWGTTSPIDSLVGLHAIKIIYVKSGTTKAIKTFSFTLNIKGKAKHVPECVNVGTRSEGWGWADGAFIGWENCKGATAVCKNAGTNKEGFYSSADGRLIALDGCSGPSLVCPPASSTVSYVSHEVSKCAALTFSCPSTSKLFSNNCGCGCALLE